MPRGAIPILVGAVVVVATFFLAQAQVFEPEAASVGSGTGDLYRGEVLYAQECAGCHGQNGEGGAGPALRGAELTGAEVAARVRQGAGVMPAGLVEGQDEADIVAYVVSIGSG